MVELRFNQAEELARIVREAGEYRVQAGRAEVLGHNFAEHAAVIGGNRQVAAIVKLALAHSGPPPSRLSRL